MLWLSKLDELDIEMTMQFLFVMEVCYVSIRFIVWNLLNTSVGILQTVSMHVFSSMEPC